MPLDLTLETIGGATVLILYHTCIQIIWHHNILKLSFPNIRIINRTNDEETRNIH